MTVLIFPLRLFAYLLFLITDSFLRLPFSRVHKVNTCVCTMVESLCPLHPCDIELKKDFLLGSRLSSAFDARFFVM